MKNLKLLFLFLFFICSFPKITCAQIPTWNWANGYSPSSAAAGVFKGLGTDAAGNIYQAAGTMTPLIIGNTIVPAETIFLAKHNSSGQVIWVKQITKDLDIRDLKVDKNGNIYFTGAFKDTLTICQDTLISQGKFDMFVAKYDSAGNGLWVKKAGGIGRPANFPPPIPFEDGGNAVGTDSIGNVYISGYFYARPGITVTFDSISLNYPTGSTYYGDVGFLAKYKPTGKIQWVQIIANETSGKELAVSKNGTCYLTGVLGSNITFGAGGPTIVSQGSTDVWYARYNTNGNLSWARSFGGTNSDVSNGIAVNDKGEFYITGNFNTNMQIGAFQLTGTPGKGTLFVAYFGSLGYPVWASQTLGSGSIGADALTIDRQGNAYIGGSFSGQINVGNQSFSGPIAGYYPIIGKWNVTGNPEWAIAGTGNSILSGLAMNPVGTTCYVSGSYSNNLYLGNHILTTNASGFFLANVSNLVNGINEFEVTDLKIYPNPAKAEVYLDLSIVKGKVLLQLTDIQGKVLLTECVMASKTVQLDLPKLAAGIYLLTAKTESQVLKQKIIIH